MPHERSRIQRCCGSGRTCSVAFTGLAHEKIPHAGIVTRVAQQVGGSAGVALLVVILSSAASRTGDLARAFDIAFRWKVGFTGVAVLVSFVLPGHTPVQPEAIHRPTVSTAA